MKKGRIWQILLVACLLACSLTLAGCEGDDGDDGAPGPPGEPGEPAPAATTNESCTVCHEVGSLAGMDLGHELDGYPTPETVTIDNVVFNNNDGSDIRVTFKLEEGAVLPDGDVKVAVTKLVPETPNELNWNWVPYFTSIESNTNDKGELKPGAKDGEPVLNEALQASSLTLMTSDKYAELVTEGDAPDAGTYLILDDSVDGEYTFTLNLKNITTPTGEAVSFDSDKTHRIGIYYYTGHDFPIGGGDTDFVPDTIINGGGDLAAAKDAVTNTKNVATIESCNECHGLLQGHGGDRFTVRNCVLCHNPSTTDANSGLSMDMSQMIHAIHAGEELNQDYTIWGYRESAHNYNEVLYPEELTNCKKCHTADDEATPDGDNWKNVATRSACMGCHDSESAVAHMDEEYAKDGNQFCISCHGSSTAWYGIEPAHTFDPAAENQAEFDVTIEMTAPGDDRTYYIEGEEPVVTVTLKAADGVTFDAYTAAPDEPGDRDGILNSADLTVYGPRSYADEVLGGGGSLLLPSEDAQVLTDSEGFKYKLAPIPADMKAGTYMVHFEGGDYGVVEDADGNLLSYQTHSTAVATFQVGTATEQDKVAGDCMPCHGETRIHVEGAHPHNSAYDTDECLACHNYSGGYGTPLLRRVHAVHSASGLGADGHGRAWNGAEVEDEGEIIVSKDITYPQDVAHCETCHTTDTFKISQSSLSCVGCHGGNNDDNIEGNADDFAGDATINHMIQNGGDEL